MDNNEAFYKWAEEHEYAIDDYVYALEIWQAAQQQSAGEIAELESELNDMTQVAMKLEPLIYEADALKAHNERLREALEVCKWDCNTGEVIQIAAEALAKTAPQCLIEHDNEVLERAANVVTVMLGHTEVTHDVADAIRALKGTP